MSDKHFQILLVEDEQSDIELIKIQLNKKEQEYSFEVVHNQDEFEHFLSSNPLPDAVVCDYHLPGYNGEKALAKVRDLHPTLPFILVTGYLDEQEAIELMREGASDIVMKQKLDRLGPALYREISNYKEQQYKSKQLQESHNRFRALVEQGGDVVVILNDDGTPSYITPSVQKIFGYTKEEAEQLNVEEVTHPEDFAHVKKALVEARKEPGKSIEVQPVRMKLKDGTWRWFESVLTDLRHEPSVNGIVDNIRDVHTEKLNARANKMMLNNSEDSFILIDRDLIIQNFNDQFKDNYKEIFGVDVQKGDSILEYARPERDEKLKGIYERVLKGEIIEKQLPLKTQEGHTRFFTIKYKPAYDENDSIIGSFISLIEKTSEEKAKLELKQNEARFRSLVENGGDILLILDEDGNPTYASPSIQHVLGYSTEEILEKDLLSIAHPKDIPMIQSELSKCLKKPGEPIKVPPARLKDKKGNWHWFEGTITNMFHDPAIGGIVDNFREITERVEAEKQIKKAKEQYQSLVQTVNGVVWEADANSFVFNYVSPQVKKILGYSADEWIGSSTFWSDKIHPDDRKKAVEYCQTQTEKGKNHSFEYRIKKADGGYIWVQDVVTVIKENEQPVSLRGLMIDITQEKELEEKLDFAYTLAQIGNWELNLKEEKLFWSDFVKKLHEVEPSFTPDLDTAINFYKKGWSRDRINQVMQKAIEEGEPFDEELLIETAKGNERWIRAVGDPEFNDQECIRVYGTTQDITDRKNVELERDKTLNQLAERVKEQRCLYEISRLEEKNLTVDELLRDAVSLIPQGWRFPEHAEACITWKEQDYQTDQYKKTKWSLHKEISRSKSGKLHIHVSYLTNTDFGEKEAFIKEEEYLLQAIGEHLFSKIHQIMQKEALDEQREQLQKIMEQSVDMICTVRDNTFVAVSAASKQILGYKPEEMIGKTLSDFVVSEDLEETLTIAEFILDDHEVTDFENRYYHKDGHKVPLFWSAKYDKEENLTYAVARDATELKSAQQAKEAERLNKEALINSTKDLIWSVDSNLNLITGNNEFIDTIFHQTGEKIGHGDSVFTGFPSNSEYKKQWKKYYERALEGETFTIENHEERQEQDYDAWFEISFNPIRHQEKITGVACFARNITDTKRAQLEKEEAEQKYKNVVEHSTNMFYQHDTQGVLNYVSPQSKEFLGLPPEKAMRNWTDFITDHPINREGEKHTAKAIQTGEVQPPYELQLRTGDKRIIWVEVHEAPLLEDGEVTGIVGSLTDITERKKYEQQLQESLERYDYVSKATRDAIYDWDILQDHHQWGDGFENLFGYDKNIEDFSLEDWTKNIHPADLEEMELNLKAHLEDTSMSQWQFEYRYLKADGYYAYVMDNGYILRDEDGNATRMIGAVRDITEDKEQEIQTQLQHQVAQFFKNEDRLNSILNNLLHYLAEYNKFSFAEIWLASKTEDHLNRISSFARDKTGEYFYAETSDVVQSKLEEGIQGLAWQSQSIEVLDDLKSSPYFIRNKEAAKTGIRSACAIPLFYNENPVGVLILGSTESGEVIKRKAAPFEILQDFLGAEIRRKQQEEEMMLLFESSPDILAITAPNKQFVRVNPAFCEILGYSEEELTSQNYEKFVHPDDLKDTKNEYAETISGKRKTNNYINRWLTKSGEIRYISWSSSDVFGEDNYVFTFGRDVTDRMELEELLGQVQRMAKIGGWELDLRNEELYWSPITKEIHEVASDYEPDLDKGINFYREGESRKTIEKAINDGIENGTPWDVELQIVTAKNNIKWVRTKGEPEFIDGECVRLFGSFQDIHDKKEAEIKLAETLEEKEDILESIGDGFFSIDKQWNVTYWNRAAEILLQTPKQKIIGENIWDIFEDAVDLPSYTNYHRVMHQRKTISFEDYYESLDKWFDINAYPSPDGISVFFKDITEKKRARQKLVELNEELEERARELAASNAELEQFAYVASHDLQEPLRMVTSFLTQLDKKYSTELDSKANQYIDFAVDGAERMRQIILDLLNYSRLNQEKLKREEVNLNDTLDDVKSLERTHIEETGAEIIYDTLPVVNANPGPIKQVFQNLINNALKYQKPDTKPRVEINYQETDSHWKFSVLDNGIGIKDEFKDTVFQIFQRLHTRDQYSGTGIGLAITKKIIERHGGEIWLKSEEGKGSEFHFTIEK